MAATLIPNPSPFDPLITMIEEDITNFIPIKVRIKAYFGYVRQWKPPQSKHFFRTYSQIDSLFSSSSSNEIALIVRNPTNKTSFTIDWQPMNPVTMTSINALPSSVIYFIFTRQMYDSISNKLPEAVGIPGGLIVLIGKRNATELSLQIMRRDYAKDPFDGSAGPPYAGAKVPS
jgi:hypothetical protein